MEENKQEQQEQAPEANNESAEQEQQPADENLASNNAFNAEEEIKKLNDRIDNVLMQLTINNDETIEEKVEENEDEDLDF